jgi:hypothetical protein
MIKVKQINTFLFYANAAHSACKFLDFWIENIIAKAICRKIKKLSVKI